MFSFWSRRGNKSPAAGKSANTPPPPPPPPPFPPPPPQFHLPEQHVEVPRLAPARRASLLQEEQPTHTPPTPEPVVAAAPNPHDAAISEVHAKLLQAEQFSSTARPRASTDPLGQPLSPPPEPIYDPATGIQRGFLEPSSSGDNEQLHDEVWAHLSRIRELQSEIATMHMHMEGIGDESGSMDAEVDNDIDVETVPTQEEEEAARREAEFTKLPGRFKGRKDNIDAVMAKLDDLSQAVTSFHALQPPPLNFDSAPTSRENTHSDIVEPTIPVSFRTRPGVPPVAKFGPIIIPEQIQIAELLHDSPISTKAPLPDIHKAP